MLTQRSAVFLGLLLIASAYAVGILLSLGVIGSFEEIYPASEPYLSLQATALASGRLGLSYRIDNLAFDLVGAGSGVQQLWGLGVPSWILTLSVASGIRDPVCFPSRIAFGIALLIVSWAVLLQVVRGTKARLSAVMGWDWRFFAVLVPTVGIVWFFPSFTATLKSAFRVYEEVVAYGYLCAILLGVLLVWFCIKPSGTRLVILFGIAGATPFVRPTIGLYGVAAVLVGRWVAIRAGLRCWEVACGAAVYVGLIGLLFWTNAARFGSPLEFGHSLSVSYHPEALYSTRFGSPFETERLFPALREIMGGLLFDGNFNYGGWFQKDVFCWQSDTLRWRENYLPAIGWPMIGVAGLGSMLGLFVVRSDNPTVKSLVAVSVAYSAIAAVGLIAFYLYCPVISSRYFYDFSGAFAVSGATAWWCLSGWAVTRRVHVGVIAAIAGAGLCLYLCHRAQTARSGEVDAVSCTKEAYQRLLQRIQNAGRTPSLVSHESSSVELKSGKLEGLLGIPFEGFGWSPNRSGEVSVCTTHFVRDMQFLELGVTPVATGWTSSPEPEWIRAKVGLEYLVQESVEPLAGKRLKIRFKGPTNPNYRKGLQVVFVAWVPKGRLAEELAPWRLHRISWKQSTPTAAHTSVPGTNVWR
jgi:hypothetical protein